MLIVKSPTYGTIIIPFEASTDEDYRANVPTYARDNTSTNTQDSVSAGAIPTPGSIRCVGMISNNAGGYLLNYNISQIRQSLLSVYNASELITFIAGESNGFYLFGSNPISFDNCVISNLSMHSDKMTGESLLLNMTVSQQIIVNTYYNPSIKVDANSASTPSNVTHAASTDTQKKSLSPINNGTSVPVTIEDAERKYQEWLSGKPTV